jgi:hypothetical protein
MFHAQEPDEFQLPSELAALERQLAGLSPAAVRVDRDRLMFAAGKAAAGAGNVRVVSAHWFWPAATALSTAAMIFLAATLAWQRDAEQLAAKPQAAEVVVDAGDGAARPAVVNDAVQADRLAVIRGTWPWSARPTSGYLGLRYVALTEGVGAIGDRPIAINGAPDEPPPPATARELLKELLPDAGRASS